MALPECVKWGFYIDNIRLDEHFWILVLSATYRMSDRRQFHMHSSNLTSGVTKTLLEHLMTSIDQMATMSSTIYIILYIRIKNQLEPKGSKSYEFHPVPY